MLTKTKFTQPGDSVIGTPCSVTSQKVKSSIVSKHLKKRHRTFKAFSTMEIREVKR